MEQPKREQMSVPRLTEKTKEMNGKSGRKLSQCIDDLMDLLEEQDEKTTNESDSVRDTE